MLYITIILLYIVLGLRLSYLWWPLYTVPSVLSMGTTLSLTSWYNIGLIFNGALCHGLTNPQAFQDLDHGSYLRRQPYSCPHRPPVQQGVAGTPCGCCTVYQASVHPHGPAVHLLQSPNCRAHPHLWTDWEDTTISVLVIKSQVLHVRLTKLNQSCCLNYVYLVTAKGIESVCHRSPNSNTQNGIQLRIKQTKAIFVLLGKLLFSVLNTPNTSTLIIHVTSFLKRSFTLYSLNNHDEVMRTILMLFWLSV